MLRRRILLPPLSETPKYRAEDFRILINAKSISEVARSFNSLGAMYASGWGVAKNRTLPTNEPDGSILVSSLFCREGCT